MRNLLFHQKAKQCAWLLLSIFIVLACIKSIFLLFLRGIFFLRGAHISDTQLYWTVGRAILNGLLPYIDIYENKPPGIFLLSSASLRLFGDGTLGFWLDAFVLLSTPFFFSIILYRSLQLVRSRDFGLWFVHCSLLLVAVLFVMYASVVAGPWQTEYFASFFATLYVFHLWMRKHTWQCIDVMFAAAMMLLGIGFKEPFFFTFLGTAVLLCESVHDFVRKFLYPIALSLFTGFLLLLLLGFAEGYFHVHLVAMLGHRVVQYSPLFLRPFYVGRLLQNIWGASPLFVPIVLLLCGSALSFLVSNETRYSLVRKFVIILSFFVAYLSVGIGGDFQGHHFVGMVPYYFALLLFVIKHLDLASRVQSSLFYIASLLISIVVLCLPVAFSPLSYKAQLENLHDSDAESQKIAVRVDTLLDACSIDRYFVLGEPVFFSWTRHTPWNFFLFSRIEHVPRFGRVVSKNSLENMGKAQIIFAPKDGYDFQPGNSSEQVIAKAVATFLQTAFTTLRPDCAGDLSAEPFIPIFRITPGDTSPPIKL